jgi:hypothetical protein
LIPFPVFTIRRRNNSQACWPAGLGNYFQFYNGERWHQSLGYKTPEAVYRQRQTPAAETTSV